jgi:hypothetical protein
MTFCGVLGEAEGTKEEGGRRERSGGAPAGTRQEQGNVMDKEVISFLLGKERSIGMDRKASRQQGGDRWVKLHEESLDFHPRFFPVFEEKREN